MKRHLFSPSKIARRKTSRELVPVPRDICPVCSSALESEIVGERTLFRHGGYGAERVTVVVRCHGCGWSLVPEVSEVRP